MSDPTRSPHRRYNPLTGTWVLVSPQRMERPWQGASEKPADEPLSAYDPQCYLCPGNLRANGERNPSYVSTFAFDNDFPALQPQSRYPSEASPLFRAEAESGVCRVVCFTPRHDLTLADLTVAQIVEVLQAWIAETRRIFAQPSIRAVHVFENKGVMMGCSNPHPHSQIWATEHLTNEVAAELEQQRIYAQVHGQRLLAHYVDEERRRGTRVVYSNEHLTTIVPYWAIWPFETMIVPHRELPTLLDLDQRELTALAAILKDVAMRYDGLFGCRFPYSMGIHQAPFNVAGNESWQLHVHFYPPLLSSPTVRKYMVGFEMMGMPQRDLTPEEAAARLRDVRLVESVR